MSMACSPATSGSCSAMEQLIGARVYLYSAKMILKNAHDGGAWEWHQDYGYWYHNGCLMPDMASCLIAVDPNTEENGCLQVLRARTIWAGWIMSAKTSNIVADNERVKVALTRFEIVSVPLEPGDAILFHCNLLHRSDANNSDKRRWNFICSYNARGQPPLQAGRATMAMTAISRWCRRTPSGASRPRRGVEKRTGALIFDGARGARDNEDTACVGARRKLAWRFRFAAQAAAQPMSAITIMSRAIPPSRMIDGPKCLAMQDLVGFVAMRPR